MKSSAFIYESYTSPWTPFVRCFGGLLFVSDLFNLNILGLFGFNFHRKSSILFPCNLSALLLHVQFDVVKVFYVSFTLVLPTLVESSLCT